MNKSINRQLTSTDIEQTSCIALRKRKLTWIIVSIVTIISIALIIIIPTTIILTKRVNSIRTSTSPTATNTISSRKSTTKGVSNKCILIDEMNVFIPMEPLSPTTIADINGDGKFDIIITRHFHDIVQVFLNTDDGTFKEQASYYIEYESRASFILTADLDNDNTSDIIISKFAKHSILIFLNNGDGMFHEQMDYSTGINSNPQSITTADIDGDNKLDIIVANTGTNNIIIFFNTHNGTFIKQANYSTGPNSSPISHATIDVDGNNTPDIIVSNFLANNIGVFLNTGDGTFHDQITYPIGAGYNANFITTADVNGDTKPDILVAMPHQHTIGVFLNNGNGTFNDRVLYPTGNATLPISVTAVNFDSDKNLDLIVVNSGKNTIGVFLNKGNGTFYHQIIYPSGIRFGKPICFVKRDINGNDVYDSIFVVPVKLLK